jgi:hypothetical protein
MVFHPVTVGHWKKEIQDQAKKLFEGSRGPKPIVAHSDPERLFSEIGRLKVEQQFPDTPKMKE